MESVLCLSGAALASALSSLAVTLLRQPSVAAAPEPPLAAHVQRAGELADGALNSRLKAAAEEAQETNFRGFSMEEARQKNASQAAKHKDLNPREVLAELQRGNARFWTGSALRPEKSAFERRALIMSQYPSVAILSCADSRVPAEIIFDQGLGDMFVVRVAGNCLDTTTHGSLLYAVNHLHVKVLVVMGHEFCGAVKAAGLPSEQLEKEPAMLCSTLKMLKAGLDAERLQNIQDARAHDREAVVTNIKRQVEGLKQDEDIMAKVRSKELIIVGSFYEISSGIVDFVMEVQ